MTQKTPEENDGLEENRRITAEEFRYEDELNEENQHLRRSSRRLRILLAAFSVLALLLGWLLGSFRPIPFFNQFRQGVTAVTQAKSGEKITNIMNVMRRYWYFSGSIDDLETRLVDQALVGMTTNEEDPHTAYMSAEEILEFTQSINRDFVGIGVQFTNLESGLQLITRVFRDSPAEKAGVQAGDIIHSVDGVITENMTTDEIKELVQGEEGSVVTMVFQREGELITLDITRGKVGHTVDGTVAEDGIGLITIEQFGETTKVEVQGFLDEFAEKGATKLIIDLRDDGGGYLEALRGVISLLLPENKVFIRREYTNGSKEVNKTDGGQYTQFSPIVLLVNENTASAAEAFTLALKENRDDVTVIGTTTYGKGSVQVTQYFDDGSALKYTDSIWKSPDGVWINGTGIEPDETVKLHEVLNTTYATLEDGEKYAPDSVSPIVKEIQLCLDFLGYAPDRTDGYYSPETEKQLLAFEKENGLEENTVIDKDLYGTMIAAVIHEWTVNDKADKQYQRALEILREAKPVQEAAPQNEQGSPISAISADALMYEPVETSFDREERYGTI